MSMNVPPLTYDAPSTTLTPYLQLPHLLSLTWLAYPILSLIFIAFRLQLSLASSQDAVANAKDTLLASCRAAERAATSTASMPRYLAIASNEQIADAVNATMRGARTALILTLTVMEAIVNFLIDLYRSTFLCFLELVIRGGLSILIGAVDELNQVVKSATSGLRTTIQDSIGGANSAISSAVDAINKVNPFGDITIGQISMPDLSALENVTLPSTLSDGLTKLNSSLPSVDEIKEKLEGIIDAPFELVKKEINDTFSGLSFNSSTLPVPRQNSVTFCADMDMTVVDDLGKDLIKFAKIGTCVIVLLIIVLILANCALEWYKWRCLQQHLDYTRESWQNDPTMYSKARTGGAAPSMTLTNHNLLLLSSNMSHPLVARVMNSISRVFRLSPSKHINVRWLFSYIFHPPALACFLIGFFGLLSVQIQLLAIGPLADKYSAQTSASVDSFSNTIATSINSNMLAQSTAYANEVNGQVDALQTSLNEGVFGWVNTTTTTLNATINEFYDGVQDVVDTIFGGTILETAAKEFVRCLIGTKVDAVENALTFLHDNLVIDMPRMNDTALMLSQGSVDEVSRPIATAAIGDGGDDDGGVIGKIVRAYRASLEKERIMFGIFMALWALVVLMGLCVIFWHSYVMPWRERTKRRKWEREQRAGIDGLVVPFRAGGDGGQSSVRSFTPLPPPPPRGEDGGEKIWDSYFGRSGETESKFRSISRPMKLFAMGRTTSDAESQQRKANTTGPFGRVAGFFRTKDDSSSISSSSSGERLRPKLTINVERASGASQDTLIRAQQGPIASHEQSGLKSTWSASSSPHQTRRSLLPWARESKDVRASQSLVRSVPSLPVPQNQDLPTDVSSTYESSTIGLQKPIQPTMMQKKADSVALPLPLHHGIYDGNRYPTPGRPIHPSSERHRRPVSSATKREELMGQNDSRSPMTRLLTTQHARTTTSLNPFATPFDNERADTKERGRESNPFASPTAL